ncbi:MAG: glycine zipper domain-containing protein [Rhodospirillaceae bacterium]
MQGESTTNTTSEQQSDVKSIGNPGGSIKEALEPARNKLSSAMSTVQEKSNQMVSGVQGYVQEAPMQSIAMAMGIGIIIGLLLGDAGYAPWRSRRSLW